MNMSGSRTIRVAGLAIAGATVAAGLAGCGLGEGVTESSNGHVKTVAYASGTEGKNNEEARLPGWVPVQAKSVTEVIRTTGSERILRYTSAGAGLPATCSPGPAATAAATLAAPWWPLGQEGKSDRVCEQDWHVFVEGGTVYAFKPETIKQAPAN
jgi:hypothetical protein